MSAFGIAFNSAAHALGSIQQALSAIQNNIVNASTPGFAAERVVFSASGFELSQGLSGGLEVSLASTRDQYLERSVRKEMSGLGTLEQKNPFLTTLQSAFSVSGDSGLPGALTGFTNSFQTLSTAPSDMAARTGVIEAARGVADAFNQMASQISQVATDAEQQATSLVSGINQLTTHIAKINAQIQSGAQDDAGVASDLNSSLDDLSELVNVTVTNNADGSATVLLGGQTPLVVGDRAYSLSIVPKARNSSAPYPGGDAGIQLLDQNGEDVGAHASAGRLGATLEIRNQIVPNYLGSQTQLGSLNDLAKTFASRVNTILTTAQSTAGVTVTPLFIYHPTDDTKAASTLAVGNLTVNEIVSNDGTSSSGSALELSSLGDPNNPLDLIKGRSFTAFYGDMAGNAGWDASQVSIDLATQQDLTTQSQNQRTQASGVSLNDQAAELLSLQQAYQATARIISILSNLSQTTVNLIPQG